MPSPEQSAAPENTLAGFAIVRIDGYADPEDAVYVKRVVWSQDLASAEVERLNRLSADKGCRYFWQYTRVDSPE